LENNNGNSKTYDRIKQLTEKENNISALVIFFVDRTR